jgi:undecaprenyl-diphosphatase
VITALSIVAVAIVCWSRIFLGVHYFSDVVGGILVGLAAVALSTRSPRCTGY